jgi:hypothetical protein
MTVSLLYDYSLPYPYLQLFGLLILLSNSSLVVGLFSNSLSRFYAIAYRVGKVMRDVVFNPLKQKRI